MEQVLVELFCYDKCDNLKLQKNVQFIPSMISLFLQTQFIPTEYDVQI
jgi:hypothetical protein